jgi:hypothetical protein
LLVSPAATSDLVFWSSVVTKNNFGELRANQYYRIVVPFATMKDQGLIQDYFIEGHSAIGPATTSEERMLMALMSDVMLISNMSGKGLNSNVEEVQKLIPAVDPETLKRVYPPVVVFDQDDLTEYVSIFNDTYRQLGTRGPNGEPLEEGCEIYFKSPDEGEDILVWKDGECSHCLVGKCMPGMHMPFDLAENKARLETMYTLARRAHGCTFPNQHMADFYRDEVGIKNIHVFPNSVYMNDYHRVDLSEHPNEVRILWQGGSSHFEDWVPVAKALGRVVKAHPHVKILMWGQPYNFVLREMPAEQLEFLQWTPHNAYLTRLNTLGHDINLAPLAANKFNSCKSAIKWYESSMITRPAATLASNVPPYSDEMIEGETGLMYTTEEEFETKLTGLIEDATLRKHLAQGAKDWVGTHRDSRKTVPPLIDFYMSLRKAYDENAPWADLGE